MYTYSSMIACVLLSLSRSLSLSLYMYIASKIYISIYIYTQRSQPYVVHLGTSSWCSVHMHAHMHPSMINSKSCSYVRLWQDQPEVTSRTPLPGDFKWVKSFEKPDYRLQRHGAPKSLIGWACRRTCWSQRSRRTVHTPLGKARRSIRIRKQEGQIRTWEMGNIIPTFSFGCSCTAPITSSPNKVHWG